jgi:hypothetical protein
MLARGEDADAILSAQTEHQRLEKQELPLLLDQQEALSRQIEQARAADRKAADSRAWAVAADKLAHRARLARDLNTTVSRLADLFEQADTLGKEAWDSLPVKPSLAGGNFLNSSRLARSSLEGALRVALWRQGFRWAAPDADSSAIERAPTLAEEAALATEQALSGREG